MSSKINGGNILYLCNGQECGEKCNMSNRMLVDNFCHHTTFLEFSKNWDHIPNEKELEANFEKIEINGLRIHWVEKENLDD